jgi:hypothetical protein
MIFMMLLLNNPIDQFLVLGSCRNFTNYIVAVMLTMWVFYAGSNKVAKFFGLNKVDEISKGLRSISSDAIFQVQGYSVFLSVLFLLIL